MVAFSVGSFLAAPFAIPLAQRGAGWCCGPGASDGGGHGRDRGRRPHVGTGEGRGRSSPACCRGRRVALVVIPLVNVVLAAVPAHAAGGASGLFGTAQQIGGAIGVAVMGTIFFGDLDGGSFKAAYLGDTPYLVAVSSSRPASAWRCLPPRSTRTRRSKPRTMTSRWPPGARGRRRLSGPTRGRRHVRRRPPPPLPENTAPHETTGTMLTSFTNQLALIAAVYGVISSLSPMLQIVRMRRAGRRTASRAATS